jgi:dinuclear metal center YbgI/SA1388 family protein
MKVKDITGLLDKSFPSIYKEDYDNVGLLCGEPGREISSALISLDTTEEVVEEAISLGSGLIISHHPVIFGGLKRLTGNSMAERTLMKALRHDIAIYAAHTNADNQSGGINTRLAEKLGLQNIRILLPRAGELYKLVCYIPEEHADKVRQGIFASGAGQIGNYDSCGYNMEGEGSFRANEAANPFVGQQGELHYEKEVRFETIVPAHLLHAAKEAMLQSHPYEEPAYDIYPLANTYPLAGAGAIGTLKEAMGEKAVFDLVKEKLPVKLIRHSPLLDKPVKKIALCGGAGSELIRTARAKGADMYITGDVKYHQFFDAENKMLIADIGHGESEKISMEIFYDIVSKKMPNFAVHLSKLDTNPINYY